MKASERWSTLTRVEVCLLVTNCVAGWTWNQKKQSERWWAFQLYNSFRTWANLIFILKLKPLRNLITKVNLWSTNPRSMLHGHEHERPSVILVWPCARYMFSTKHGFRIEMSMLYNSDCVWLIGRSADTAHLPTFIDPRPEYHCSYGFSCLVCWWILYYLVTS